MAVEIAWSYLKSSDADKIYNNKEADDIDGSIYRGWKVFVPSWYGDNMIENCNYAIIGICPDWIYYAK